MRISQSIIYVLALIMLAGCATPPFNPSSDIRISSVSSGTGGDEIRPNMNLIESDEFPFSPAVIMFQLNNGVGVTMTELNISYSAAEGNEIVYQDANGIIQTGIAPKLSRIHRYFAATIPWTELSLSGATQTGDLNKGSETLRNCCIYINLVTEKANDVLSVDGDFNTKPNFGANVIANLTIRGIDDNNNPFSRYASILVSPIPERPSGEFEPDCDDSCSIGQKPSSSTGDGGGTETPAATEGAAVPTNVTAAP
jgi:hypothetical protein